MRGNLLELAVAFIMGAAFTEVTKSFSAIIMDAISKLLGSEPDFSGLAVAGVNIGTFIMAVISFLLTAAVLYFLLIKPLAALRERFGKKDEAPAPVAGPTELEVLTQIRDMLAKNE